MTRLAILGTRGIPARYGGFETFAEQLSIRLVRRGVDVTVFCPSPVPRDDEIHQGVKLKFVMFPKLGRFSEMFWDARCYCVARRHFDVVYMLGLGGAFAAWVPRIFGRTVWVNTDGVEWRRTKFSWPERGYLAFAEALSVFFATRVIADSAAIAAYLRNRYPGLTRVSTIAYGADVPEQRPDPGLIQEWGLKPDSYYVVICRLEPENHLLEIVTGFKRSDSKLSLVILGNTENPNLYVQRLLRQTSEKVHFLGTVYEKEKLAALRFYARAYLHGHSVGGTNPSLLEAMACSNLVVAHDNPFNREVLDECGLYFRTPSELASALNAIEARAIDREAHRCCVTDRVRRRYHWDHIANSYLTMLEGCRPRAKTGNDS